ncbi:hypothetical protein O23A_P3p0047 (plasmid) [Aeromonas salmonicida]|nr:hypothetical protein O23A_P3p0047 [Aeromonas salmonicida]
MQQVSGHWPQITGTGSGCPGTVALRQLAALACPGTPVLQTLYLIYPSL